MSKVVIYGNGQLAELAVARLHKNTTHDVQGFMVEAQYIKTNLLGGLPVYSEEEGLKMWPSEQVKVLVAIGYVQGNHVRAHKYLWLKKMGYGFINLISPRASIGLHVTLGENCIVGDACILEPYTKIGNNVSIGSGSIIGHHSKIQDHCYLSTGVNLSGNVELFPYVTLGSSSTIRDNIQVKNSAFIGAGVVLQTHAPEQSVYSASEAVCLPITTKDLFQ